MNIEKSMEIVGQIFNNNSLIDKKNDNDVRGATMTSEEQQWRHRIEWIFSEINIALAFRWKLCCQIALTSFWSPENTTDSANIKDTQDNTENVKEKVAKVQEEENSKEETANQEPDNQEENNEVIETQTDSKISTASLDDKGKNK